MSRLTGNDAYGLMEAYSAVYQPRLELTEEQVWEEVEEWVNALIEEGYDLSDYTWEEMYEAYIEEARAEGVKPYKPQPLKPLPQAEEVDVYDVILSHLLDEGYASSVDAAEAIMVNMSEDWRDIIIEEILDEANGRAQRRSAARGMITHQTKIGTMTKGVDPKNRIGPEGYLRHRGETEPKPTSELRNTSPAGRRRSEARDIINKRQTNLRTMTRDVDPGDRTGPEGYLRHMGKTRG